MSVENNVLDVFLFDFLLLKEWIFFFIIWISLLLTKTTNRIQLYYDKKYIIFTKTFVYFSLFLGGIDG